jgi:hypothetical protein
MIRVHNPDSSPHPEGIEVIKELIQKRVDASFFEDEVLERIISKAGGSLRDTCYILSNSAFMAHTRGRKSVDKASLDFVLKNFAKDLFLRVLNKYYPKVKDVFDGDHKIKSDEALAELLYAGAVFEYDGEGWVDLHPLIREYVSKRQGILE